jgi:hypothetical protein
MKATVRKNRCRCQHCGHKWVVTYGNYTRKTMSWKLAISLANALAMEEW